MGAAGSEQGQAIRACSLCSLKLPQVVQDWNSGSCEAFIHFLTQSMGAKVMAVTKTDPHRALEGLRKALSKWMTK